MRDTTPRPFVFVLMPFVKEFDDVYKLGIKPACEKAGAYAERVDEQIFQESILQRIYNQVAKADVIVSDMTGRNPNVFYETGYAHALGKHVILLTQDAADIPFDLKHYPHIVYRGRIADLIPELEKRVRWSIEHPQGSLSLPAPPIEFYINGISLLDYPTIEAPIPDPNANRIELKIDANNPATKFIKSVEFEVAFVTSHRLSFSGSYYFGKHDTIKLPNGNLIHPFGKRFSIFPGAWETFNVNVLKRRSQFSAEEGEKIVLRMFSEFGCHDFPFELKAAQ